MRSYELFARWVMPRFQGSLETTIGSREWCSENRAGIFGPAMGALKKAFIDAGQEVPDMMRMRLHTGKTEVATDTKRTSVSGAPRRTGQTCDTSGVPGLDDLPAGRMVPQPATSGT